MSMPLAWDSTRISKKRGGYNRRRHYVASTVESGNIDECLDGRLPFCQRWFLTLFTTVLEPRFQIMTSTDVEEAYNEAERRAVRAAHIEKLSPLACENQEEEIVSSSSDCTRPPTQDDDEETHQNRNRASNEGQNGRGRASADAIYYWRQANKEYDHTAAMSHDQNGSSDPRPAVLDAKNDNNPGSQKKLDRLPYWRRKPEPWLTRGRNPYDRPGFFFWPDWGAFTVALAAGLMSLSHITQ